ncbi:hypothetical protein [Aminobacter aminovorans]|jgi:hypothetical protein|uniref:1,4-alpha-glucan branching enzyme n=1 Tax=Aminobacter aminovorans TaxID=83263 RepID=A0AAC8YVI0_AMIAI|nr:hypothetical protein [Aminobacter aminovorans]AMS45235.1 hypothetical protein AA2016_6339 [Aminobacter aminovorans]MBB3705003.1 hypothetical protein [Aminobacter aminovorans]
MSSAQTTFDHDIIRRWADQRGGKPSRVRDAADGGILRLDFGEAEPGLEEISWEEFFEIFDKAKLAFLYQDKTDEGISRFNKFVDRF